MGSVQVQAVWACWKTNLKLVAVFRNKIVGFNWFKLVSAGWPFKKKNSFNKQVVLNGGGGGWSTEEPFWVPQRTSCKQLFYLHQQTSIQNPTYTGLFNKHIRLWERNREDCDMRVDETKVINSDNLH